jgi:hypothetical protein
MAAAPLLLSPSRMAVKYLSGAAVQEATKEQDQQGGVHKNEKASK